MELKKLMKGFAVSLTLSFVFWQCTKIKTTDIGADLIPAVDNVHTFDTTLTLVSNNYLFGDSAVPYLGKDLSGNAPEHVLGLISSDPQFGKTAASIYMELKPPSYPYNFETTQDSLYLDSVVLCLKWNSTWGDTSALQQIGVYALDDQMKSDSIYYTTATFNYTEKLGGRTFAPEILNDSLQLLKQKVANQLRIPLKNSFGNLLLSQSSAAGNPYYNDSSFRAFFKGYAIVPETPGIGGNALMSFAISDTNTCVRLYYRYTKNGKEDTTSRRFIFGNAIPGGNATNITRDYSGSQIQAHLATPSGGDSLVYVQTAPGSYSKLHIPSIEGFMAAKGNVMVHLAELSMIQVPGPANEKDNVLVPPEVLYLDYQDTVLKRQLPFFNDAFLANKYDPRVFGGIGKKVVGLNGQIVTGYNFYITRYIQNLITLQRPNFPLFLYAPYTVYYAESRTGFGVDRIAQGRIKLGGGKHSSQKMKLRIIYSKI